MSQYGKTAILATQFYREGKVGADTPERSWAMAADKEILSAESRKKCCPKGAYLGLCAAGLVRGVPCGDYVKPDSKEKKYVTVAVELLKKNPEKTENLSKLWDEVLAEMGEDSGKQQQQQMSVVVSLWKNGDIKK